MNISDIIASFLSGVLGSMGLGGGTVLILYLTMFGIYGQKQAQGINLIFFIPCALYSVISYTKSGMTDRKTVLSLTVWGIVGAVIGYIILAKTETALLSKLFGVFLIILGLKELFSKRTKKTKK